MKQVFLIICFLFVFFATSNADEFYKCTDSSGSMLITSIPQDGMKCVGMDGSKETPKQKKQYSSKDLLKTCEDLSADLEDTNNEIQIRESNSSELKRDQLDIKERSLANNWSRNREWNELKPSNDELYKINKEISLLYQKRSLIVSDIKSYKCNELKNDLSKLNQKNNNVNKGF